MKKNRFVAMYVCVRVKDQRSSVNKRGSIGLKVISREGLKVKGQNEKSMYGRFIKYFRSMESSDQIL